MKKRHVSTPSTSKSWVWEKFVEIVLFLVQETIREETDVCDGKNVVLQKVKIVSLAKGYLFARHHSSKLMCKKE